MRHLKTVLVLTLLLAISVGCDDDSPTDPMVEVPPPAPTVTDTFMGTLTLAETSCHVFNTMASGPADIRITALAPLETLTLGLGLGNDDGDAATDCSYFASDQSVRVFETLVTQVAGASAYCVCIFDVGNVFPDQTVSYTFTVEHP